LTVTKQDTGMGTNSYTGAYGQTLSFVTTVGGLYDSTPEASEVLSYTIDGAAAGTATTNSSGVATHSYKVPASLSVGNHTLIISAPGNAKSNPSSESVQLTVTESTSVLVVPTVTGEFGQTVPVTATLTRSTDGALIGGATLSFTIHNAAAGTAVTNSLGVATLNFTIPASGPTGNRSMTVSYAGDSHNNPVSKGGTMTVSLAPSQLVVSNAQGTNGVTVNLVATLTRTTDGALLSGKAVSFMVGTTVVGSATTNASGVATLPYTIPSSTTSNQSITASYGGDLYTSSTTGTGTLLIGQ
jgi:hypothetical protein